MNRCRPTDDLENYSSSGMLIILNKVQILRIESTKLVANLHKLFLKEPNNVIPKMITL